jgi:hypothetical protein
VLPFIVDPDLFERGSMYALAHLIWWVVLSIGFCVSVRGFIYTLVYPIVMAVLLVLCVSACDLSHMIGRPSCCVACYVFYALVYPIVIVRSSCVCVVMTVCLAGLIVSFIVCMSYVVHF